MNERVANNGNLEANSLKVIQSITMASQMRLDESYDPPWIRLAKSHNPIIPKTDLGTGLDVRLARKLAESLIKTSSKAHEPKIYNKAIDNPIHGNR